MRSGFFSESLSSGCLSHEWGWMRIVAGTAKGRKLAAPRGSATRPMMDRAKEGIFSSIAAIVPGARVLDLFAGSGSLGLEAMSRGAASCVFVENDRRAIAALDRNVEAVGLGGQVIRSSVERYLADSSGAFDLAFVDPPYALPLPSVEQVLAQLAQVLADDAVVVVHRRAGEELAVLPDGLTEVDRRKYGQAEITRLMKAGEGGGGLITALVPGSFDPPTNGHIDVIKRCASVFDRVVVAVVTNPSKQPMFTSEERIKLLEASCDLPGVDVESFDGLLVDFASTVGANVIVKGLRAMTDFDYELQHAQMNRHLSGIVTMFVATKPELGYLSSSLIKEISKLGRSVDALVPAAVARALKERTA